MTKFKVKEILSLALETGEQLVEVTSIEGKGENAIYSLEHLGATDEGIFTLNEYSLVREKNLIPIAASLWGEKH